MVDRLCSYVFDKIMLDLTARHISPTEAKVAEIKEYVCGVVENFLREIGYFDKDYQFKSLAKSINTQYDDYYEVIEDSL